MSGRIIDAVIITPNLQKDKYIHECLKSLRGQVDHVSIVERKNISDFAEARNYAIYQHIIKFGKPKYLMTIDSDERLFGQIKLKDYLKEINDDVIAITFQTPQYYLYFDEVHHYKSALFRIWKPETGMWYRGKIHESNFGDVVLHRHTRHYIPEQVLSVYHLGYNTNRKQTMFKCLRNLTELLDMAVKNPSFNTLKLLSQTLIVIGAHKLGQQLLSYIAGMKINDMQRQMLIEKQKQVDKLAQLPSGGYDVIIKNNDNSR